MTTKASESSAVCLCHYVIASADMYYTEEGQCDVFLEKDNNGHIRIWGQTSDGDSPTRVDLCQVFLEYGLYCSAWCNADEVHYHMQSFGERLGHRLAKYLLADSALLAPDDLALSALEQVFESIGADFFEDRIGGGARFQVTHCPVESTAKRHGLPHVELARYGINAMCRSLLLDINPHLIVNTSADIAPGFIFTLTEAEVAY